MRILKIFNNNAVATIAENNADVILTGSGIGFQKKIGDEVDEGRIEKRYSYEGGEKNAMYQLFARTPEQYFRISQAIMEEAEKALHVYLKNQTIVALTDHISFAVERYHSNTDLPNLVLTEIKTLYKKEYQIGLWGLRLMEQELGIPFHEDEAGYITLHIINGSSENANATLEMLQMIEGCIQVIEQTLQIALDEESLDYVRLTTHLKFMAQRILNQEYQKEQSEDREMMKFLSKKNKNITYCVNCVKAYIEEMFTYSLSEKEMLYLMIHIHKLTT